MQGSTVAFPKSLSEKYRKPVYITDIAFHSFSGDNMRNSDIFDARIPLVADQQEQANEYDSFLYVMSQNKGDCLLASPSTAGTALRTAIRSPGF